MFVLLSSIGSVWGAAGTITVDDTDAAFEIVGPASEAADGGYQDHFYYQATAPTASTFGRWTPPVSQTGLYTVSGFVPFDPATSAGAPLTMFAHGEIVDGTLDQSIIGGDFHSVFGGRAFKLVAGGAAYVEMNDGSGESGVFVGFDAFRFTRIGDPGAVGIDGVCATTPECADVLVCDLGSCREPCTVSGCAPTGTCDGATGLCDVWPIEGTGTTDTGPGTDTTDTGTPDLPVDPDGWPTESTVVVPPEASGCGCATGGRAGWVVLFAGLVLRRRASRA